MPPVRYSLREWKRSFSSTRTRRTTDYVSYHETADDSDPDYGKHPKRKGPVPGLCEPSKSRIQAQAAITNRKRKLSETSESDKSSDKPEEEEDSKTDNTPVAPPTDDRKPKSEPKQDPDSASKPDWTPMTGIHKLGRPKSRVPGKSVPHKRPKPPDLPPPADSSLTQPDVKPKGELTTTIHGLVKRKRVCKFKCRICGHITDSQASANTHYKNLHPRIKCDSCDMMFNNPSSLARHSYIHKDLPYPCKNCGKLFPFESALTNHRAVHRRHPTQKCNKCEKWFFTTGELNKHLKVHEKHVHQCFECSFTCPLLYSFR